jgi:hypothetical protein
VQTMRSGVMRAALATVLGVLAMGAPRAWAQAGEQPNPAIEDWKPDKLVNVEILPKTMAPDAVITLMKSYNEALHVDCVFCHKGQVGKPWSTFDFTDTSKKRHETARLMMRTTQELNEKFKDLGDMDEDVKVTCATCHRRSRHPEIEPPAAPANPAR